MRRIALSISIGLAMSMVMAAGASAQGQGIPGQMGLAYKLYRSGNNIYRYELQRQGRGNQYAPIGSPQFFRNNFPPVTCQGYSGMTGGVFVQRGCPGYRGF